MKTLTTQDTAYLLTALLRAFRRANTTKASATDSSRLGEDLAEQLPRLAASHGSVIELVTGLCQTFTWKPTFDRGGPIQVFLEGDVSSEWSSAKVTEDGKTQVPWTELAAVLEIGSVRAVCRSAAPFIAACAISGSSSRAMFASIVAEPMGTVRRVVAPEDAIETNRYLAFGSLLGPLSHGGFDTRRGNATGLRRELRYDLHTGRPSMIPMISAAAVRGQLRRCALDNFLAILGLEHRSVEPALMNSLLSGGGLDAGAQPGGVAAAHRVALRELCPLVDLFGGVFSNELMTGALLVYDLLPLCAETAGIAGEDPKGLAPAESLVIRREGCRRPDLELEVERDDRMIFSTEALAGGSTVFTQLALRGDGTSLRYATGAAASWAIQQWQGVGAVGAREAQGYGSVIWGGFKNTRGSELDELYEPHAFVKHVERWSYKLVEWLKSGRTGSEEKPKARAKKNKRAKKSTAKASEGTVGS